MNFLSSSPPSLDSKLILFSSSQNPSPSKFHFTLPIRILHSSSSHQHLPPLSSNDSSSAQSIQPLKDDDTSNAFTEEEIRTTTTTTTRKQLPLVRRPVMEFSGDEEEAAVDRSLSPSSIDAGLSNFAKQMPIFEPERVDSGNSAGKPLSVNLDLALYRAKVVARKFQYREAELILQKCIYYWPEDGRPYVSLGKILSKQSKNSEAKTVYEKGCQATQGENPYIWQCWAVLENKMGNIRRARELFDAATVADKRHVAAWHGWAVLEIKQENIKKARNLLSKGLKFCGGNEYIYQTLALLEAKANRFEQARYLFRQATKCNPKSCASWLAWAQLEIQQENYRVARQLFERAVQASPKNRFAWHVWGVFEANLGNIDQGRKLLRIGHALNPRDPVLLQSLALLEYKNSTANIARVLFRRASELDPMHQPVWIAWGWMEWKEGNITTARELYQKALWINSTSESAARCLQAWGVLEQRIGNLSAARRLFRSSLNINSQSYITWMTWASLEENQGNFERAEEIRNLYFQQRTEVVDEASWVMGFLDIFDPAIDRIKRLLKFDKNSNFTAEDFLRNGLVENGIGRFSENINDSNLESGSSFNLDAFIREKLSLDPSRLDALIEASQRQRIPPKIIKSPRKIWRLEEKVATVSTKS